MNTDRDLCTLLKADAVCVSTPSGILPAKYAGLTTMYGNTTEAWV